MENYKNDKLEESYKYIKYIIIKSRRNEFLKLFTSSFKLFIALLLFISVQGKKININDRRDIRNLLNINYQISEVSKCLNFNKETNKCTECPHLF